MSKIEPQSQSQLDPMWQYATQAVVSYRYDGNTTALKWLRPAGMTAMEFCHDTHARVEAMPASIIEECAGEQPYQVLLWIEPIKPRAVATQGSTSFSKRKPPPTFAPKLLRFESKNGRVPKWAEKDIVFDVSAPLEFHTRMVAKLLAYGMELISEEEEVDGVILWCIEPISDGVGG